MQYKNNNNNIIDLNIHTSRTNVTFNNTVTVGQYNHHNNPNAPIPRHIEPTNFPNRSINPTKALFKDTLWHLQPKKMKRILMATTNQYETLEDDDLEEYDDYTNPWELETVQPVAVLWTNKLEYEKGNW